MFYVQREGTEPEVCSDAANAAYKASVVSAMHGVDVEVIQQRERDRVVIARASRGIVSNVTPPPEPPAPSPFAKLEAKMDQLINVTKERI